MKNTSRPLFYQPVFGNDNGFISADIVDIADFVAPTMRRLDAALVDHAVPQNSKK